MNVLPWAIRAWAWWATSRLRPWAPLAVLFGLAAAVRLTVWDTPIYGDEAVLYYFSRHPGQDAANVHVMDEGGAFDASVFFWWRPLFRLLYTPAALVSFDAYRLMHIAVTSLLPVLTFLILRDAGTRRLFAFVGGLAAALHPVFVIWGVIVFPDAPMVVAFAAGVWCVVRNWPKRAAAAFTAAIWLKEVAVVGVGFLLVWSVVAGLRSREVRPWPLRLGEWQTSYLVALVAGYAPLWWYLREGGKPPGWTPGGNGHELVDFLLLNLWFLPLILLGLVWRRTRLLSALALVYPLFYIHYAWVQDRGVEIWYIVQPNFLSLIAVVLVLDEWRTRWAARRARWTPIPHAASAAVVCLLLVGIFVPSTVGWQGHATMPYSKNPSYNLEQNLDLRKNWDDDLEDLVAHMPPEDWGTVFLVDIGWFFIFYPFGDQADTARYIYTDWPFQFPGDYNRTTKVIESMANATVLGKYPPIRPLNQAMRDTYVDCVAYENPTYVLIHGQDCQGRRDRFVETHQNLTRTAPPPV